MTNPKADTSNILQLQEEPSQYDYQKYLSQVNWSKQQHGTIEREQHYKELYSVLPPQPKTQQEVSMRSDSGGGQCETVYQEAFQLKNPESIISNPSGAPLSDFRQEADSSKYSRLINEYDATLIKWDSVVPDDCQDDIVSKLKSKMDAVEWSACLSSTKTTLLYVATSEGIKRDCFTYGQKRVGGNIIKGCEPPVPWTKTVDPYRIRKELTEFLQQQYWQVTIRGDRKAHDLIKELRSTCESRKRENKYMFEQLKEASKPDDKKKALGCIWEDVLDRYSNTLVRLLIDPKIWINDEFPVQDPDCEIVRQMLIQGKWTRLKECYRNAQEMISPEPRTESELETLKNFVEKYGVSESIQDVVGLVNGAGHGRILRSVANLLFGPKTKQRTIWLTGVANSGKSQFIRRIRQILASDELDWRGVYLPVRERTNPLIKTQLITCEEFSFKNAFSDANYHVTKMLFEGEGASVRKDLYAQFVEAYKDVGIIIASNNLPGTEAQARDENFNKDIWAPVVSRVDFIYMTERHANSESFPYTRVQLANALFWLSQHMGIVEKLQEIDMAEVPELYEAQLKEWHQQQAKKQGEEFMKLVAQECKQPAKQEDMIDLFANDAENKCKEEAKQEETHVQVQRADRMVILGDCGGSQCAIQCQPVLGKRENPEEGGDCNLNSVVASLTPYKRQDRNLSLAKNIRL